MTDKIVNVYTTETCPWCHRTKEYLKTKGVAFNDFDVSRDREKAREMIKKSGQMAVPVIEIGGEIIVGFNQSKLDELLAK